MTRGVGWGDRGRGRVWEEVLRAGAEKGRSHDSEGETQGWGQRDGEDGVVREGQMSVRAEVKGEKKDRERVIAKRDGRKRTIK